MLLSNVALPRELLFHGTLPTDLPFHNWTRGSPKSYDLRSLLSFANYVRVFSTHKRRKKLFVEHIYERSHANSKWHTHTWKYVRDSVKAHIFHELLLPLGAARVICGLSRAFPLEYIQSMNGRSIMCYSEMTSFAYDTMTFFFAIFRSLIFPLLRRRPFFALNVAILFAARNGARQMMLWLARNIEITRGRWFGFYGWKNWCVVSFMMWSRLLSS